MASPDTDELATLPLPSGAPKAEQARPAAPDAAGVSGAEPQTVPQQQIKPLAAEPGATEVPPLAAEPGAAEAQTVPQERVEPELIEPAEAPAEEPAEPGKPRGRWWRGFTGSLAAGLTVLAIGVLVVAGIDLNTGAPGPGAVLLIGHPVAAILALLAQRVADRRNGAPAAGAGVAVVLFTVSALTLFWLT